MAALATPADLGTLMRDTPPAYAENLLAMASAAVEGWCRRTFSRVADDEVVVTVTDGSMRLLNGPVESVSSVVGPAPWPGTGDGPTIAAGTYRPTLSGYVRRAHGRWPCGRYVVTYTHGYAEIPGDVSLVVCQMVADLLGGPGGPITAEAIGQASTTYEAGAGRLVVPAAHHATLARYRQARLSTVEMAR